LSREHEKSFRSIYKPNNIKYCNETSDKRDEGRIDAGTHMIRPKEIELEK
jgi:hypothetical protein